MAYIRLVGMDQCNANSFSETEEDDHPYERTDYGPVKLTSRQDFFHYTQQEDVILLKRSSRELLLTVGRNDGVDNSETSTEQKLLC